MTALLAAGGLDSFGYHALFAVHILAITVAFGVPTTYAALGRAAKSQSGSGRGAVGGISPVLHSRLALPASIVAGIAGIGLIGMSGDAWAFEDTWVSASFAIVILVLCVSAFWLLPALKKTSTLLGAEHTDEVQLKKAMAASSAATGVLHLGLTAIIILMIWKPS